jgi:tetratricopeptide (TPR) repeat protein
MEDRAQLLRRKLPVGSMVQITTHKDQHVGEVVEISDHYIELKTSKSSLLVVITDIISFERKEGKALNTPVHRPARNQIKNAASQPRKAPQDLTNLSVDQLFAEAGRLLHQQKNHSNAIYILRQVLKSNPDYPGAKELLEQSLEIARVASRTPSEKPPAQSAPRQGGQSSFGRSDYFARALQASSDEEAIQYLYRSIEHREIKSSSAIKDLANRLAAIGRGEEALEVLKAHRARVKDQQSVDNLLIHIYIKLKRFEEALSLLEKKHAATAPGRQNLETLKKIADCHIKLGHYHNAIPFLKDILDLTTDQDNRPTLKRLALCHMQNQHYRAAEEILREILEAAPTDEQALELQRALQEAKGTGRVSKHILENMFSDTSHEISALARFFLARCEYRGVSAARLQDKKFDPSDIDRMEQLAAGAVYANNYKDATEYYLSAASIVFTQEWADTSDVYKYLSRSFALRADSSLRRKSLDIVQEWYCEALFNLEKMPRKNTDEKDALKLVVKFLSSLLGEDAVPLQSTRLSIEDALEATLSQEQQRIGTFEALAYLTQRSKLAKQLLLSSIFAHPDFRVMTFTYLTETLNLPPVKLQESSETKLTELWNLLDKKNRAGRDQLYVQVNQAAKLDLKQSWADRIETAIKSIRALKTELFLPSDRSRVEEFCAILDLALRLFKETTFEQREYFCERIGEYCRQLLENITDDPTRLSVECFVNAVEMVQVKAEETLKQIYDSSEPQITLSQEQTHYVPDAHQRIVVHINASNGAYCSPAEAVDLTPVKIPEHLFAVEKFSIPLDAGSSLSGGHTSKIFIPLRLSEEAIQQEALSLSTSLQYRTRLGKIVTRDEIFSIHLDREQFEKIEPNPYAPHVKGTPVEDPGMFFGRSEFITKIARTVADAESKGVVIYGQKRAGKSSILHHLKLELEKKPHLLVANIGSITTITPADPAPLLHQFLWKILDAIKKGLMRQKEQYQKRIPRIPFPKLSADFYSHPAPLTYFEELLDAFRDATKRSRDWENIRVVLLLDEFQYIYQLINDGHLPAGFMQHWKALLERSLFNAVLVGQNVMTKFRQEFPNEFDAMQEEPVSYLEDIYAQQLIEHPIALANGKSRYLPDATRRILNLTAGSPYYIQIFCYYLVEYLNRERTKIVTEAIVEEVKYSLLRGKRAKFTSEKDFDNLISSGDPSEDEAYQEDAIRVMACIAKKSPSSCLRGEIDSPEDAKRVDTILNDYVGRGVLHRDRDDEGQSYSLYVGLFRDWLNLHK